MVPSGVIAHTVALVSVASRCGIDWSGSTLGPQAETHSISEAQSAGAIFRAHGFLDCPL